MKEELLHYIWQQKLLAQKPLLTTDGKVVEVQRAGQLNSNSGPDFFDARLRIDETLWAGNVEIHLKSSDWIKHKHQLDSAYQNVILHVVFEHDLDIGIPTIELKNWLAPALIQTYKQLQENAAKIPCQQLFELPDENKLNLFLQRLTIERLEQKCTLLEEQLRRYQNSWEKLFYVTLAKYFGMRVNAEPFIQLAESLPATLLAKHKHNPIQIESLLFGVGGFLPVLHSTDAYTQQLNREYTFLRDKYNLPQVNKSSWKFARTRPANFPTIRIAQFAALVHQSTHLFSRVMGAKNIAEVQQLLQVSINPNLNLNALHQATHHTPQELGKQFLTHLLINAIIPVMFVYGKHQLNPSLCEQALDWLQVLASEKNKYTRFWNSLGVPSNHAADSQALLHLEHHYCTPHKCLQCVIGNHILQKHV